ncbi:MAG: hypothetical protein KIS76_17650 [Pyrinomonadaceae bacterium]|nr:hypothetical protein [Pyrinomonadaceae bacterium]
MENQAVKEIKSDDRSFLMEAADTAGKVVKAKLDVDRIKEKAGHVIEDSVIEAKRMIKKGRYAAEDLVEDTAHRIKKDPLRSVGVTFGVGLGLGVFIGMLLKRKINKNLKEQK